MILSPGIRLSAPLPAPLPPIKSMSNAISISYLQHHLQANPLFTRRGCHRSRHSLEGPLEFEACSVPRAQTSCKLNRTATVSSKSDPYTLPSILLLVQHSNLACRVMKSLNEEPSELLVDPYRPPQPIPNPTHKDSRRGWNMWAASQILECTSGEISENNPGCTLYSYTLKGSFMPAKSSDIQSMASPATSKTPDVSPSKCWSFLLVDDLYTSMFCDHYCILKPFLSRAYHWRPDTTRMALPHKERQYCPIVILDMWNECRGNA